MRAVRPRPIVVASSLMTVDVFVGRRRGWKLGLVTFALIIAIAAGGTFAVMRIWVDRPAIAAPAAAAIVPVKAPVDPVETGSIAAGDEIGDMIQKLDVKAT